MTQPCGCCAGIRLLTPETEANRPGLDAVAYRIGTYGTFLETMLARLSDLAIDVQSPPGSTTFTRLRPLQQLTTRAASDPAIALLDAWAVVADVLTFYQERFANEGYLPTATERRSVLELARLVGYRFRPGVAASVNLAFTAANDFKGVIPAGTRAQSIPSTGESAQFFETAEDLPARDTWNYLAPRVTRPQLIVPPQTLANTPLVTGTDVIDTLYFAGITTNLKVGDALVFVFGSDPGRQFMRTVETANAQPDEKRTEVSLVQSLPEGSASAASSLQPFVDKAAYLFPGSDLASDVADILETLTGNIGTASGGGAAANLIRGVIAQVHQRRDIAFARRFTRVVVWLDHLLQMLDALVDIALTGGLGDAGEGDGGAIPVFAPSSLPASPLAKLGAIVEQLTLAPSLQPANSRRLVRSIAQSFSPQSDLAPQLLATLKPAAAPALYRAWSKVETPSSRLEVQAARVKAALFASSFMGPPTVPANGGVVTFANAPTIATSWIGLVSQSTVTVATASPPTAVALDAAYDQVRPGSWVAIDRPIVDSSDAVTDRETTLHRVIAVRTQNMNTGTGYSAKVTLLTLNPQWLADSGTDLNKNLTSKSLLRGTVVYAQTELLELGEEPLDTDVEGATVELDGVYDGLEAGRWIIVSGNRTDVPNVSGVTASELVMISGVAQGERAPLAIEFPSGPMPFSSVLYTTDANALGDRLVVGKLVDPNSRKKLSPATVVDQQYRDQVQLAPGVYVNAYVPTQQEIDGSFPDFEGLLVDPDSHVPFPRGLISSKRLAEGIFAWRISSRKLHTILTLANALAYKYDTRTIKIYGNVVKATHGQTVGEVLGNGDASQAFQRFALRQPPLTYISAPTPSGAESTLQVRVNEIEWHEVEALTALGPRDRSFITDRDDAEKTAAIFGNGEHGARLPSGSANVKATYRYGIGKSGNVKAGQISQLATHPLGAQGVLNPLPATGGADGDSRDRARRNAPLAVMALDRLVSVQDYADFARTFAGIGKASAVRLSDGQRQLVHVTIAGVDDIPIDRNSDLYRNLLAALQRNGDPFQPIGVCVRKVALLIIAANVQLLDDYAWESVEPRIRAAMLDAFGFERRELGQSAFLSEAIAVMQGVEGVSYVYVETFDSVREDITAAELAGLAGTLQPMEFVLAQLAHVNTGVDLSSVADVCQRILPAELVYLTPDIPSTLILRPIGV